MSTAPTTTAKQTLAAALARAQTALQKRALTAGILSGLPVMLWLIAVGGCLALVAAYWIVAESLQHRLLMVSAGLVVIGVLWMVICIWRSRRTTFSLRAAAERLDAAQDPHNRIATAWSFSDLASTSPFMQAAIAQGLSVLQNANPEHPALPPLRVRVAKIAAAPLLLLLVLLLVTLIDVSAVALRSTTAPNVPIAATNPSDSGHSGSTTATNQAARTNNASHRTATNQSLMATNQTPAGTQAAARQNVPVQATNSLSGGGATSASASPTAAAGGAQQPSTKGAKASASASKSASQSASPSSQAGQANAARASIPNATAGSNAGRATGGDVDSRDRPGGDDELAEGEEPEPVDESTQNNQRGGLRASLLDRRAAASRELGITGPNSKRPGTGRGGPSPAKKSRGTASIIMGVPVPDFLPGQRRPGPFITTDTRVPPTPSAEATPNQATLTGGETKEALLKPYVVPYTDAQVVANYLAKWHATQAGQTLPPDALPPDGEEGDSTQSTQR